jgi:hypothetical protein
MDTLKSCYKRWDSMVGQNKKFINTYEHYQPHNNEHTKVWLWFVETKQADREQLKLNIFLSKPA